VKVHIKVVVSTAGNDEEYVGKHLGMKLLGRPLERMVVTFEEEMDEGDFFTLTEVVRNPSRREKLCQSLCSIHAIKIHSVSVTRNVNH